MEHPFPQRKFSLIALEKLARDHSDDSASSSSATEDEDDDDTPSPATDFSEMGEDMDMDNVGASLYPFSSGSTFEHDASWKPLYPTDETSFGPDSFELAQALQDLSDPSVEPFTDAPIFFPGAVGGYGYPVMPWEEYLGENYHNPSSPSSQNWDLAPPPPPPSQQQQQTPIESAPSQPQPLPIPAHPILSLPAASAFKDIDFFSSGNMDWLLSLTSQPNSAQFPVARYGGQSGLFPVPSAGPVAQQPSMAEMFRSVPVMFSQQQDTGGSHQSSASPQFQNVNTPSFQTQPQTPPATPKFEISASEAYDNSDLTNNLNRRFSMWPDYQEDDEEMLEESADEPLSPNDGGWRDAGSCVETALSISPPQYDPHNDLPEFSPFYFGADGQDGGYPGLPPMPHFSNAISWAEQ